MVRFGGHIMGFNLVNYFSRNADNILVGRVLGAAALGLYAKAYGLFTLPLGQIRVPVWQVSLPMLRQLVGEPDRYRKYYLRLVDTVTTLTLPIAFLCVLEADLIVDVLLGPNWSGAVPAFRILALAGLIQPSMETLGNVQLSLGESRRYMRWGFVSALVRVSSFVAGVWFGIVGVAVGYTASVFLLCIPTAAYSLRYSAIPVRAFFSALLPASVVGLLSAAVALCVQWADRGHLLTGSWFGVLAFMGVYVTVSLFRSSVRHTIGLLRRSLRRESA